MLNYAKVTDNARLLVPLDGNVLCEWTGLDNEPGEVA